MNPTDHQLDRLLRGAARAPQPAPFELSFPAEARVLAAWRGTRAESLPLGLGLWLRAGLASAVLVAAVALVVSWSEFRPPAADEFAVADATFYVAVAP